MKRRFPIAVWLIIASLSFTRSLYPSSTDTLSAAPIPRDQGIRPSQDVVGKTKTLRLPAVVNGASFCPPIVTESYTSLTMIPPPTDRPAEYHPDLNLAIRGYEPTNAPAVLIDYVGGPAPDQNAPQLPSLVPHTPAVLGTMYQVYDWNWTTMTRGSLITDWPVTLAGIFTTPGEIIQAPISGYNIGLGYTAVVLYASSQRITLKYTLEDSVVSGYTIHVEGVCVEPSLLARYNQNNAAGRAQLPALKGGQGIGRAIGTQVKVAIRDTGAFMDPRSRLDWWHGYPASGVVRAYYAPLPFRLPLAR